MLWCINETKKEQADFKIGIIGNSKPSQDWKIRVAVVKCMLKGRIATLTWGINRHYPIQVSPCLLGDDVSPKLKFMKEKNITFLKENGYIDSIFLVEGFVLHVNVMLLLLFVQDLISFQDVLCYSLVDMRANLGVSLTVILSYASERRELLISKHKLKKLDFLHLLRNYKLRKARLKYIVLKD